MEWLQANWLIVAAILYAALSEIIGISPLKQNSVIQLVMAILSKLIGKTKVAVFLLVLLSAMSYQLLAPPPAHADSVTLAWDTSSGATGYKLHYGTATRTYTTTIDVQTVLTYTIPDLPDNSTFYFAATAYDAAGNESDYSVEVSYATKDTIAPNPPGNFRRIIQQVVSWFKGFFGMSLRAA
jgi:hypothetical protein